MSETITSWTTALTRIRQSLGGGIALLLIVLALYVGYRLGSPASRHDQPLTPETAADTGAPQLYTCSMHPSVRLTDPNARCPICFMTLIPVEDGGGAADERGISITRAAAQASRVETAPVARFFPNAEARLYGKVAFDETSVARLTSYFPARIDRLFVNYLGVPVAKGDHIAQVYSPELIAAAEELRQASRSSADSAGMSELVRAATLDTASAAREKLRLYGLTGAQIDSIERGESDAERMTIYAPIGGVVTELSVREGDYVREGSPIATVADLSRLWLDLEAYESQLPMLRWGQRVTFTVEAHPGERFEGRISFIEPMVSDRTRTAAVRVAVDNSDRRLKPGMFASAVVRPRMSADGAIVGDDLAGHWVCPMHPTIVRTEPGACEICGMDLVPAETLGVVDNPSQVIEPLVVPRTAVLYTGVRSVVYVEVPDTEAPTYEGREIVLGPRAGDWWIVRSGLREGERVVINGAFRIDSAMQISARPSMMTPGDGAEEEPAAMVAAPASFTESLTPVYTSYLDAQEALAGDDLDGFRGAARALAAACDTVRAVGLLGEPLESWRRASRLLRAGEGAGDIDSARERFETMSEAVIALHETFGHEGGATWRIAMCPMAFDFEGARWVQRDQTISNPYFGASMLRCGEIQRELAPNGDADPGAGEGGRHE
ncbi:MAG: efflux RND transporter periplasmic adaptor subunit [Phycisphaeraceae bacterium]|nr:efflux RND transporter periplasmic adaptor subunit [Phycisphaeraceae bacterium]